MEVVTTKFSRSKLSPVVWLVMSLLAVAGIFANQYFGDISWLVRFFVGLVLFACLVVLSFFTTQGSKFWRFVKDAKMELYKVVWPSRDETVKTTAIVASLVFAMSIILWCIDTVLFKIVGWLAS